MLNIAAWPQNPTFWILVGFHVFVLLMLALDMGVLRKKSHVVGMKEAAGWTTFWVGLAALFAAGVYVWRGKEEGLQFVAGYVVELSLSVDNLFVFLVIFKYFSVPEHLRYRVLFWGILGALVMRAVFILAGFSLLHYFEWIMYLFGAFLIYTGLSLLKAGDEEVDPERNWALRLARRWFPLTDRFDSERFFIVEAGKRLATPMFLVLLVIESTDVMFALDSIPAIFAISKDLFVVYTSNIFAVLGLRALYFLLAGFMGMFRYLNVGLAFVLVFVGIKMMIKEPVAFLNWPGFNIPIGWSLAAIAAILAASVFASLRAGPEKADAHGSTPAAKNEPDSIKPE